MREEQPKRWKRGDIGPDGRVFWSYRKASRNGEWWMIPAKFQIWAEKSKARSAKYHQKRTLDAHQSGQIETLRKKAAEKSALWASKNPEKVKAFRKNSYYKNHQNSLAYHRDKRERMGKEKIKEIAKKSRNKNRSRLIEIQREWRSNNKDKLTEYRKRQSERETEEQKQERLMVRRGKYRNELEKHRKRSLDWIKRFPEKAALKNMQFKKKAKDEALARNYMTALSAAQQLSEALKNKPSRENEIDK